MRMGCKNRIGYISLVLLLLIGSCGTSGCGSQSDTGGTDGTSEGMSDINEGISDMSVSAEGESSTKDSFKIVTSFYPLYIMVMNLTDDVPGVELSNMADPQTGCLHDYQLRPADLISIEGADMFLANGGGMEDFLADVLETYPELTIVYALNGVEEDELLAGAEHDHGDDHDGDDYGNKEGQDYLENQTDRDDLANGDVQEYQSMNDEEENNHEEDEDINPHTWLDPSLYKKELTYITSMLAEMDAEHAELYEQNLENYMARIDALMAEYVDLADQEGKKGCVLLHESFAYLAEAYGFPVLESIDVEKDSGFSAKEIRTLIDEVEETGAGIILSDSQYSGRISELLSRETGMEVYQLDSGVSGDYEKDAWLNSMRKNLEVLEHAAD